MTLMAPISVGGMQLTSIVGATVSAVARDLTNLLNGRNASSTLARDALGRAMQASPPANDILNGTICRAMLFLAGYGLYISTSADRTVGRILDALHSLRGSRCLSMVGPYNACDEKTGRSFCRIGKIANGVRQLVSALSDSGTRRKQ